MDHGDFAFFVSWPVVGPEVGPERKWQGLGPTLSIASAATACMASEKDLLAELSNISIISRLAVARSSLKAHLQYM